VGEIFVSLAAMHIILVATAVFRASLWRWIAVLGLLFLFPAPIDHNAVIASGDSEWGAQPQGQEDSASMGVGFSRCQYSAVVIAIVVSIMVQGRRGAPIWLLKPAISRKGCPAEDIAPAGSTAGFPPSATADTVPPVVGAVMRATTIAVVGITKTVTRFGTTGSRRIIGSVVVVALEGRMGPGTRSAGNVAIIETSAGGIDCCCPSPRKGWGSSRLGWTYRWRSRVSASGILLSRAAAAAVAGTFRVQTQLVVPIVLGLLVLIGQQGVRRRDSLEYLGSVLLFGIGKAGCRPGIGMVLLGQLAVGSLDVVFAGRVWQVQRFVGIVYVVRLVVHHACSYGLQYNRFVIL